MNWLVRKFPLLFWDRYWATYYLPITIEVIYKSGRKREIVQYYDSLHPEEKVQIVDRILNDRRYWVSQDKQGYFCKDEITKARIKGK